MSIEAIVARADGVKGYMYTQELRWLAQTARALPSPAAWCEIGCWQGRSATAVAAALPPNSRLLLVDNFTGPTTREMPDKAACRRTIERAMEQMRAANPDLALTLAVGESAEIAETIPDETFDVCFIDGDHAYAKVLADIRGWRPKMKPGGLMCGHDFTNRCGVEPAVREEFPVFGQVEHSSIWFARV